MVSGNMGGAIAGLKVPDDSQDLLPFRVLHHPSDVQDSGDVLPPVRSKIQLFALISFHQCVFFASFSPDSLG